LRCIADEPARRAAEANDMDPRRWLSPRPELTRSPLGAVLLGAYVLLYLSWQVLHWLPGKQELGQLLLVPVDAIALYAAWRATRRCPGCRPVRAFWRLMTLAIAAETIADVLLSYNDVHYAQAPFPTLADPFFLAYFVLLFLALLRVPVAPVSRVRRLRTLLDGATIVIGGGAVVWYFVLGPTALAGADSALAKVVSLAYPLGDLILLAGLAGVLLRRSTRVLRTPLLLITAAIVCSIVADVVYGSGVLHGTYTGGDPVDTLYLLAFALFALAAGAQAPVLTRQTDTREADFARPAAGASWLPYLGLAVGLGLVLGVEAGDTFFPDFSLLLIVVLLAVLVAVRQWVVQHELLRLQDALRESERRFRAIFDNAGVGITYTDLEGPTIVDVNATFARMVGRTTEQLRGSDYSSFAAPEFDGADRVLAAAIRDGHVDQLQQELGYVTADGRTRWAMLTISTLRDERRHPTHVVGIFEDVTRRREAERVKDEFLSVVGHELRTPLTSIRGSLGLLESGVLDDRPEEQDEMLAMAISNTDRLARLVNDILDVERMQAGRLALETDPVTAATLVESSLEVVQGVAEDAGVTLDAQLESVTVAADADRVVQTLVNLIGNAIKFTPRGGRVAISARRDGDLARFSVRDTGRGIPAERLESIFERFNQVDASDAREKGGTGLGLAVSRGIVEQHGGRIWAESAADEGASFHFTLPLAERAAPVNPPRMEVTA
jgi:PAS domain S-box-containing protein